MTELSRIADELEYMITENLFTEPKDIKVRSFIRAVHLGDVDIADYLGKNSKEKYGEDLVVAIREAAERLA